MAKSQKTTIFILAIISAILAIFWISNEIFKFCDFNFEPAVTVFTSLIPIFSLWWPFKPRYTSKRIKGKLSINLHERSTAIFGGGEYRFEPYFSSKSKTSIYVIVRYHPDFKLGGSAIAGDAHKFSDVKDASKYQLSSEDKGVDLNDILLMRNRWGNYALLRVVGIDGVNISFEYLINPVGGVNFS